MKKEHLNCNIWIIAVELVFFVIFLDVNVKPIVAKHDEESNK